MKECEHEKIRYCKECVYYICIKCGALSHVRNPIKFWSEGK